MINMKYEKHMDINIDLDGVLRNMADKVIEDYTNFYDSDCKLEHEDIIHYDFTKTMPKIKNLGEFFIKHAENIFYNAKPYEGAVEFVKQLKDDGHNIRIVTHQLQGTEEYSLKWIRENKIPYDSIHFAKDKFVVRGDVLIDDYIGNLEDVVENTIPLAINRPWNWKWSGLKFDTFDEIRGYLKNERNNMFNMWERHRYI